MTSQKRGRFPVRDIIDQNLGLAFPVIPKPEIKVFILPRLFCPAAHHCQAVPNNIHFLLPDIKCCLDSYLRYIGGGKITDKTDTDGEEEEKLSKEDFEKLPSLDGRLLSAGRIYFCEDDLNSRRFPTTYISSCQILNAASGQNELSRVSAPSFARTI